MIQELLKLWAKNIHRLDEAQLKRECGIRPYGIEYRIMLEGGVAKLAGSGHYNDLIADVDLVWHRIHRAHAPQMIAVREYYKRGSYRSVRLAIPNCSQHMSTQLVKQGEDMIRGAMMMLY